MAKILLVSGDDDYGAMTFDSSGVGAKAAFELAKENGGSLETEIDGTSVNYGAYEFGDIDPKFIDFIRNNIMDYDDAKHTEFYVITERKSIT